MPASNLARVGLKSRDSTKYTAVTDALAAITNLLTAVADPLAGVVQTACWN